ncbi:MAG TPA: LysM domain-containing protein [Woeseiaceae bacterium]|nr:LysM domain-containing protein [Woeseiaceae bacterium]
MFPKTETLTSALRLTALALAASTAGCSLNPFAGDDTSQAADPAPASTPVYSSSSASRSSSAGSSQSAQTAAYEPELTQVSSAVPLAAGHPDEYVVQVGDTLWDIAGRFLNDPWYWPEIWYVNPNIENPHLIYPGDVLGLVYIDGQPRITNVRASTYRLSPQARVTPLTEAVTSIPYEAISAFLRSGVVLEKKQADELPYLLETRGDHLIAAAGNEIYVRGLDSDSPGTRYSVVHIGDPLVDPDNDRVVGYQGIWVGDGTLRRGGDPATVWLTDTAQEAIRGDRLLPEQTDIPLNFFPKAPSSAIDGRIMSVIGGVTQIGQYQVVVMNRGARDGLETGDVLTVFQTGEVVEDEIQGGDVKLPDEEAGTVMVFKVYDGISYGLVMEATQAIHIHDAVRNPI